MSLLKIKPFSVDQVETFTFANANIVGNINSGNANLGNLASANYFSGNASLLFGITAGNITGQVANALVAGTVYTAAQPNITSVGTLTSLTVSGSTNLGAVANVKITGGSSGYVLKTDGAGNLTWGTVTSGTGNANVSGSNSQLQFNDGTNLSASANLTFDVSTKTLTVDYISANGSGLSGIVGSNVVGDVSGANHANVADSANSVAGANVSGAVNLATYATTANSVAGANVSGAVSYATTANSVAGANVSGEVAYANVANSVAGANVSGAVGLATYATTANAVAGANVSGEVGYAAVANSVAGANVSGYVANANHANVADSANSVAGANVTGYVANADHANVADSANSVAGANVTGAVSYATTANSVAGANVSGAVSYATTANSVAGANVTGQVGNALVAGTVYTAAQPNITSVGTLTSLDVSGSITSGNITITGNLVVSGTTTSVNSTVTQIKDPIVELGAGSNGAALTNDDGLDRGQLLHYYAGGAVDAFMGWDNSNLEFALGSNVTVDNNIVTFNEFGGLRVGNINALNANLGNAATANYFIGNGSLITGVVAVTAQTVTTAAQPNITSVGTLTSLSVTGNITAGNVAGGNLVSATYISGNGSLLTALTGANVTGTVGNASHATVADSANSVAGANVSGEVGYAAVANSVAGANVSGQVGNALVAGTVYTAAQPNITSVGTLTSLSVSGTTNLGAVGNITITGGGANYFLKTDGSGTLSWSALPSTTLSVDTWTGDGSWTMKTLSSTPLNINYTIVAIGGVFQPREAYDVTGAVITFDDAPPNGAIVEVTIINGGTAGSAGYVYQGINADATAVTGVRYLIDTSGGAVTVTLPASASLGDEIGIIDATGNASTHNITVNRNGGKIEGASSNITVSTDRSAFTLVYYNSTQGWIKTQK